MARTSQRAHWLARLLSPRNSKRPADDEYRACPLFLPTEYASLIDDLPEIHLLGIEARASSTHRMMQLRVMHRATSSSSKSQMCWEDGFPCHERCLIDVGH